MKREKLNVLSERDILIGLITSDKFCREICPVINPNHLELPYARIVSTWIKEYFLDFKKAPKSDMMKLYRTHCEELTDDALQNNILTFIEKLNDDYNSLGNEDFAIEESVKYLKLRALKNLSEDINAFVTVGDESKAEDVVTKFRRFERESGESANILNSTSEITQAFINDGLEEELLPISGALGKVIGKLHREDFVSVIAPMKRGKTHAMLFLAEQAMKAGLKVMFFSLEMSREAIIKRLWTTLTGQSTELKENVKIPYFEKSDYGDKYEVKYKYVNRKAVDITEIEKKQKAMKRMFRGGTIEIVSVPSLSLTVEKLESTLDDFEQKGYVPDVIIVDYADIMLPSEKGEYRHQLDGIWKRLRGLAQKRKALVITATQSSRKSLNKDVDATDVAEDVRKIAHVTSMFSLNQTEQDVKNGILRVKQVALREGEREFRQALCTQCLTVGSFIMDSKFDDEVEYDCNEENDYLED